jgi:hypothetical protein
MRADAQIVSAFRGLCHGYLWHRFRSPANDPKPTLSISPMEPKDIGADSSG